MARRLSRGFTLLELLVVAAIIALGTAAVSLSLRDAGQTRLEREALRLTALLEAARAYSRASGVAVRWLPTAEGFRFSGWRGHDQAQRWLNPETHSQANVTLSLGPEPMLEPQFVQLGLTDSPAQSLRIATDGLRPFAVRDAAALTP